MSRVGKLPIVIPNNVNIRINDLTVEAEGPKGKLTKIFAGEISIVKEDESVRVSPLKDNKQARAMWGTARSIINSMVKGVKEGFTEELELNGVGFRAIKNGDYIKLLVGKSHSTMIKVPSYISLEVPKPNLIVVNSVDKEKLGQFISSVIKQRPPEPYKGKGIKKKGQYIQRKEGKKS